MVEFTLLEAHFHDFSPTNTAPLIGRGESADADLDDVPVEEAEAETDDDSGGVGGLLAALVLLAVLAVAARKLLGGDDELAELEEIDDAA